MKVFRMAVALFCATVALPSQAQVKPNILWITIEDTSPQFIGCYGNKNARTPVIDQLASEGIRFTNAFSTGTVCSPSRTALITGVKTYEAGTGNHRSNYPVPDFIKGFPYYLQQQGYYTSNNSKTDYNVANTQAFIDEAWDESSNKAGWWKRKAGQPFFAVFNIMDSHQSRTMTNTYAQYQKDVLDQLPAADRIAEDAFEMPPFYRDSPEMRKQFARVYNAIKLTDNKIGKILERLDQDKLRDSTIIFFFADHGEGVPRGKTNGINLGYRVPFVLWIPDMYKHLSPWKKSGMITDELIDFSDLAPTLISLAGGTPPEHMKGKVLMGKERQKPSDHLVLSSDRSDNGIDLVRSVTDGRFVYSRNYMPYMPEARYIRYMEIGDIKQQMRMDLANNKLNALQSSLFAPRPTESLYDIEKDVWETKNLAQDPAYKSLMGKMRKRLDQNLTEARDVLLLPEYEIAQLSKTTTPYSYRLTDATYPFKKVYAAASLSGIRSKKSAKQQVKLLTDASPVVRYWAAMGLHSQNKETLLPFKNSLQTALSDSYPPVKAIVSSILVEVFEDKQAESELKTLCLSPNPELALMAVNELLYLTDRTPFVETVKTQHERLSSLPKGDHSTAYKVKAACIDVLGSLGLVPNNPTYSE
ncbi:arylsulfatase A-like enzyme [Dyadobacter jejuensis]|uniref:Arylsulfatase A-like enzyme n=1 Tax=Dyadobacter jejuensis TaxID=1082580 RepID=A0A316ARX7_9BACT|nr:sulfatase [Dyadobacter jejuensis]PWJ60453.1 arylsulfatase A-like enzyme [Dyadobacter jejuensis]